MAFTKRNDDAVSPVIGVILMVAITVIIAAVIASFVFGMAGNIKSSKTVGITLALDKNNNAVATVAGGTDLPTLLLVNYSVNSGSEAVLLEGANLTTGRYNVTQAGSVVGKRVILVGYFNDGTTQTLVDKQF
ncbi:type IV pilin N-terminal domain-containing protein [uncultured Methanoregula sp.]|uniref:type IV pilin N-terminal domain-containing protein n=1 Tax=uncultured Methanoregula sp. TaxID=1005933 RepID=UPI002AAB2871|nr:type IV pilin N-terminal domain-containing protein [uncultured Methanoregula sp.]